LNIGYVGRLAFGNANCEHTYVNIIYFQTPLYMSVLQMVPIYAFIVGLEEENKLMPLLGIDVINNYTSTISRFDGKIQLRITDLRDEL
jgi:hypothetical protein